MEKFNCTICGKNHQLYTHIEAPQPEIIGRITSGELNQELNVVAKNIYLINREYGLFESELKVRINDSDDNLEIFVWVKVNGKIFYDVVKKNKTKGIVNIEGELVGAIPFYNNGIKVLIEIDLDKDENAAISKIIDKSTLKLHFEKGITKNQMIEMYTRIYHTDKLN